MKLGKILVILGLTVFLNCELEPPEPEKPDINYFAERVQLTDAFSYSYILGLSSQKFYLSDIDTFLPYGQDQIILIFNTPSGNAKVVVEELYTHEKEERNINWWENTGILTIDSFRDSAIYQIILKGIDGNRNGRYDSVFDYVRLYFSTPPYPSMPDTTPIRLISPKTYYVSIPDTIEIRFNKELNEEDLNAFLLYTYPADSSLTISPFLSPDKRTVYVPLENLVSGKPYRLFILGDSILRETHEYFNYFDANEDGIPEKDDNAVIGIWTMDSLSAPIPFYLLNWQADSFFISLWFNRSVKPDSIELFIQSYNLTGNYLTVDYTIDSNKVMLFNKANFPDTVMIFISRSLQSRDSVFFDGNKNGIGGEPGGDDLWLKIATH